MLVLRTLLAALLLVSANLATAQDDPDGQCTLTCALNAATAANCNACLPPFCWQN